MVKAPRQRTFVNGALAQLDVLERDKLWFPGGYCFDVPKGAAAVYIGTLRYFRDDRASPSDVRPSLLKKVR